MFLGHTRSPKSETRHFEIGIANSQLSSACSIVVSVSRTLHKDYEVIEVGLEILTYSQELLVHYLCIESIDYRTARKVRTKDEDCIRN